MTLIRNTGQYVKEFACRADIDSWYYFKQLQSIEPTG